MAEQRAGWRGGAACAAGLSCTAVVGCVAAFVVWFLMMFALSAFLSFYGGSAVRGRWARRGCSVVCGSAALPGTGVAAAVLLGFLGRRVRVLPSGVRGGGVMPILWRFTGRVDRGGRR